MMRYCIRPLCLTLALLVPWTGFAQTPVPDPVRTPDTITADEDTVTIRNLPSGRGSASITVSGYCSCTLVIEGKSTAAADWEAIDGAPTIDADGVYFVLAAGLAELRVRADAWTSGTTTISMRVSSAGSGSGSSGGVSADVVSNGANIATQTTAAAILAAVDTLETLLLAAPAVGVYVEDAAETAAGNLAMAGSVRRDTAASSAGTTGDNATINTDSLGRLWVTGSAVEDAAETAGGILGMVGTVRRDAAASSAGTDGDNATLNTDASGRLWVNCGTGCSGGTQYAEDLAHVSADLTFFISGIRRDTTPSSSAGTAGDYTAFNLDANGRLYTNTTLYDAAGAALTIASDKTEDVAESGADTGPLVLGVRRDTAASSAGTSGDFSTFNTDAVGRLWTSGAVVEDVAEAGADQLLALATVRRDTAASSAGTTGDFSTLNTDSLGRLWVTGSAVEDAAETAGGILNMAGAVVRTSAVGSSATAGDNATFNVDGLGRLYTRDANPCMDFSRITSVAIDTAASGNVELVALNGSDLIYICAVDVVVSGAVSTQLIYGTGTACATGETNLTGAWSFAANGGIAKNAGGAPYYVVPAGNAFCVETSGAVQHSGSVTYVRTAAP